MPIDKWCIYRSAFCFVALRAPWALVFVWLFSSPFLLFCFGCALGVRNTSRYGGTFFLPVSIFDCGIIDCIEMSQQESTAVEAAYRVGRRGHDVGQLEDLAVRGRDGRGLQSINQSVHLILLSAEGHWFCNCLTIRERWVDWKSQNKTFISIC